MIQKKRVVVVYWKTKPGNPFEVFSSLKNFCLSYRRYNYNTLSNYLSKEKIAYDSAEVRIERKEVFLKPKIPSLAVEGRKIVPAVRKVKMRQAREGVRDLAFWLSKPPLFRIAAITEIITGSMDKYVGMDKTRVIKRKLKS